MKKLSSSICMLSLFMLILAYSNASGVKLDAISDFSLTRENCEEMIDAEENVATYIGIAKYYDNRRCVVTSSHDDLFYNTSAWENLFSMLTRKKIYHTVGIITNSSSGKTDWNYIQHWLNRGYMEVASHSRNHVHPPYEGTENGKLKISYEWQIMGSQQDIVGNLTLPALWRCGEKEYVYVWIEPYGQSDMKIRYWLGVSNYLVDRRTSLSSTVYDFVSWDSYNGLFNRVGYTVEIGNAPWGGETSIYSLNSKFDKAYREGKTGTKRSS